jgi:D-serine deaminase-like pyridoxal phosphate-dependent protein
VISWQSVENEQEIPTPALLIDLDRVERNLRRMLDIAGGPERLRPHVKTHKLGPLVQRQLALGISKFKCATIAEAEMLATSGARDVMLAFPPAGPNIARLLELTRRFPESRFSAIADHPATIRGLDVSARDARIQLEVLLDIDCGMQRTGIPPGPEAKTLYRLLAESPGLLPGGLHVYDGHNTQADPTARCAQCEQEFAPVLALRSDLEAEGLNVPRLVAGGSPTFPCHAAHSDRELSPGTTVLWDFGYGDRYADLPFEPAAILLTRVISKPSSNRLCLDLGHKAVAAENPHPRVRLLELPDAVPVMHSEEHLVIETPTAADYSIGQTLHGIPRHVCPTVALHSEAWITENGRVTGTWPIEARARRISI